MSATPSKPPEAGWNHLFPLRRPAPPAFSQFGESSFPPLPMFSRFGRRKSLISRIKRVREFLDANLASQARHEMGAQWSSSLTRNVVANEREFRRILAEE